MYQNMLIAADGSKPADKAVDQGIKLAKALGATVTAVTVTELWSALAIGAGLEGGVTNPIEDFERAAAASARKTLDAVKSVADREGVTCKTEHVPDRRPSDGIVDAAKAINCDLIVMGSHGRRGIDRLLLGSQAAEVLAKSTVPVLIVR